MKIQYVGTDLLRNKIQEMLSGRATIISDGAADVKMYEVSCIETLYKLPATFQVPTFLFLTTKDIQVTSQISRYPVAGVIAPPFSADSIINKINQGLSFSGSGRNPEEYDTIKAKILAKASNIPPLPIYAQQLIKLTKNDKSSINDVIDNIKRDQGLSSKIIKLVNSPFFGVRQEITSIDRATVLVGLNTVKNLALAISTDTYYQKPFSMYGTTGNKLWLHAYNVARICEIIGEESGLDADALYLAGLLHDMGKTIMVDFLVKEVKNCQEENEQFGFTHAEVGNLILRKWDVAEFIVEAVRKHHGMSSDKNAEVLKVANLIEHDHENAELLLNELSKIVSMSPVKKVLDRITPIVTEEDAHEED